MKSLFRLILLLLLSAGILYFMNERGLFNFSYLVSAFRTGKTWVFWVFATQFVSAGVLALRYLFVARMFNISSDWPHVTAATFVSAAVGQWAPGSLAVIEVLRVGLMIGAETHDGLKASEAGVDEALAREKKKDMRARVAASSALDRLVGFFVILVLGATVSFYYYFLKAGTALSPEKALGLLMVGGFSGLAALGIGLLPFLARWRFLSFHLFRIVRKLRLRYLQSEGKKGASLRAISKLVKQIQSLRSALAEAATHKARFVVPLLLSVVTSLLSCLALYFASLAIGDAISFIAILSVFPVMAVVTLLPIGFAGMGGQQLVAVALFDLFALSPTSVSSASLLQTLALLVINTVLGITYAQHSAKQIKAILFSRRARLEAVADNAAAGRSQL